MNNKDIPESEINERVARAQGLRYDLVYGEVVIGHPTLEGHYFDPLTNHNQYHEIMTPDMEAKVNDVLDEWLMVETIEFMGTSIEYFWHNPKYQANPRLWKLRAVCEVLSNADTQ